MTESREGVDAYDADPRDNGEHVEDLAAAYALGALDDDERRRIDHHLATCPTCQQAIEDVRGVTSWLPFVSPSASRPSPAVKIALLARVQQDGARPAASPVASPVAGGASKLRASRSFSVPRWGAAVVPAALVVLLLSSLVWSYSLSRRLTSAEHQSATYATQLTWLYSGQAGAQIYVFEPISQNSQAGGRLCVNNQQTSAMVIAWALDPSRQHVLWAMNPDGTRTELMPLRVSANGNVMQMVSFVSGYNGATLMIATDGPESSMELMLQPSPASDPATSATPTATTWPTYIHPVPLAY